ncbi:MAG TPA: fibrobacter succinogenes major paralogous domain-containing protein [bacterium]|nr:fibrobacter succinogenes major paralogous domain-containing protein [bacterium]HPN42045.1 fibrobacter succinogenes major paralogous domain-containing protein [bacterium]
MKSVKLILVLLFLILLLNRCGDKSSPTNSANKPPACDVTGRWLLSVIVTGGVQLPVGTQFYADIVIRQADDGTATGSIVTEGGAASQLTGRMSGTTLSFTIQQSTPCNGTFNGSGTITENCTKLTGKYSGSDCNGTLRANITSLDFEPLLTGTMSDYDGNTYQTVKIGEQWWMAENLQVTHYRDGTEIPNVTDNSAWANLTTGAYCDYNNNPANSSTYGRLYNLYALLNNSNIAPEGWHIPSTTEWETLADNLGGMLGAGDKLKEAGTAHWSCTNSTATNESGFTALPAGMRNSNGVFEKLGEYTVYGSVIRIGPLPPMVSNYKLSCADNDLFPTGSSGSSGISVRLVKDSTNSN